MLSSLGMSKSQVRKMCLKEAGIISTIGIAIGVLFGYILSLFIVNMLSSTVNFYQRYLTLETIHATLIVNFPLYLILIVAITVYIIVFISALLPLRKMKKIDIISGIKGKNKKAKYGKVPFIIDKFFKQEGILSYRYSKFQKARHGSMVITITISVAIFLIINGIIANFFKNANKMNYDDYKISASVGSVDKIINYLEENKLIDGYFVQNDALSYYSDFRTEVPNEKISDVMLEILEKNKNTIGVVPSTEQNNTQYNGNSYRYTVIPYYFDEDAYNNILKMAGISELKENECILVNTQEVENSVYGNSFELTKYEARR